MSKADKAPPWAVFGNTVTPSGPRRVISYIRKLGFVTNDHPARNVEVKRDDLLKHWPCPKLEQLIWV